MSADDLKKGLPVDRRQAIGLGAGLVMAAAGMGGPVLASDQNLGSDELLTGIDHIVVVMMENRSFDQYFGMINSDRQYPSAGRVNGLTGKEFNLSSSGVPVYPFPLSGPVQADPPHDWNACHEQWNLGRNDGFVKAHKGAAEREAMGYLTRKDLPFSYWLADNFTLCDNWFSGVLGPTWPNRAVLHAATAHGLMSNRPYLSGPKTIWEALRDAGIAGRNYYSGAVPWYAGAFLTQLLRINPTAKIDQFFRDAEQGTLPQFSIIDPDFQSNDDHPSHSVALGQVFIGSIYKALAASPNWSRSLLIVTYDEHGGFYDHVPPPACLDDKNEFRNLGFRVPTLIAGPTVKVGSVCSTQMEHATVAATLGSRFRISQLNSRMGATADISSAIDPDLVNNPRLPPGGSPFIDMPRDLRFLGEPPSSQEELTALLAAGRIPPEARDDRSTAERVDVLLTEAQRLGVIR